MSLDERLYQTWTPPAPIYSAESSLGTDCSALIRMATLGAMVGGSVVAAQQLRDFQSGVQTPGGALVETGKAALTAGLATAAAGAIASSFAEQGMGRMGLMFLIGTAAAYAIQGRLERQEEEI